ncbi:MAG: SLBB domain-containing protein, partial [Campylobacterota bacterium]|nr:SLBB domain-containing protein [Campylobacterota bacterium]
HMSDAPSFKLYRESIALEQKKLLDAQLNDLEAKTLTAGSLTTEEAIIRKQEAELVLNFIERAKQVQPKGQVIINKDSNLSNIFLEDGDNIYIPKKSHMVIVQGEVMLPGAQTFVEGMSFDEYINSCGGFSFRANDESILIIQKNGKVTTYDASSMFGDEYIIHPGDAILVLGKVDAKYLQVIKDITQIVYQIAVGAAVVLRY